MTRRVWVLNRELPLVSGRMVVFVTITSAGLAFRRKGERDYNSFPLTWLNAARCAMGDGNVFPAKEGE